MQTLTCVVIGGGYAGIHAVKGIQKAFKSDGAQTKLRLILIDKNAYHLRKVLLFKAAAGSEDITIQLTRMFPDGVTCVQGTVTKVETDGKTLHYHDHEGQEQSLPYDMLVLALGSVVRRPDPAQGGLALADLQDARQIQEAWRANLSKALSETNEQERRRLLTFAVAGAGISGIETSAELAHTLRQEAERRGIDPRLVTIQLYNANARLFPDGPAKVGLKLEQSLQAGGVSVIHNRKVVSEKDGTLTLANGLTAPAGLLVWTLGLLPNPVLRSIGVPVDESGYVRVDESYRVHKAPGVYSIGDCARITDANGREDGKTCKEATAQADRLARVIAADLAGRPAPTHKPYMDLFCFGLGPEQGMVWTHKWGLDFIFTGKLGWRMRKFTWDIASLVK